MLKPSLHRGFTLIETMVVVTIIAVFMLFALPEMNTYLTNSRTRNAAQTFKAGLMKAQAEAIRINDRVEFVTTSASPPAFNSAFNVNGKNWVVVRENPTPRSALNNLVESRDASEGSTTQVTQTTVGLTATPLTFNALGGTNQTGPVFFDLHPPGATCAAGSSVRCMGVLVSPSGRIHLCVNDPSLPVTDRRSCN